MIKLKIIKKYNESGFFVLITTLLVVSVLFVAFLSNLSYSYQKINSNKNDILEKLKSALVIKDTDVDKVFEEVKTELIQSGDPVIKFLSVNGSLDSNLNELYYYIKSLVKEIKPLADYKFTGNGLENTVQSKNNFTDDLDIFFGNSKDIIDGIKNIWSKLWYYKLVVTVYQKQPILNLMNLIDDLLNFSDLIYSAKTQILYMLGHFSARQIVIFNQNTSEARPTGGFIGSYIPIELFKGKITIKKSQTSYYISDNITTPQLTHPANWYYGDGPVGTYGGFQNTNYFSCFPDTARYLEHQFNLSQVGYAIDTVIFLTPDILQSLLPDNFVLKINDDLTLNSSNLISEIERITSIEARDLANIKQDIGLIFNTILNVLPDTIKQKGALWMFNLLVKSVYSRDIQIWFKDQKEEQFYNQLQNSQSDLCENTNNVITPLISNISGDKRNLITRNDFNIFYEKKFGSTLVNIVYTQTIPDMPSLQRGFNEHRPLTFVGIQVPSSSTNLHIKSDQALVLPAKKTYYEQNLEWYKGVYPETTHDMDIVLSSIKDFSSDYKTKQGFSYIQPNGSTVMGIYVSDDRVTKVNFSFEIPSDIQYLNFYGQPGLNMASVSLGDKLSFYKNRNKKVEKDRLQIQSGLSLIFD